MHELGLTGNTLCRAHPFEIIIKVLLPEQALQSSCAACCCAVSTLSQGAELILAPS